MAEDSCGRAGCSCSLIRRKQGGCNHQRPMPNDLLLPGLGPTFYGFHSLFKTEPLAGKRHSEHELVGDISD